MQLSFAEIKTWQRFEDLVAAYFRRESLGATVTTSGSGPDGGKDLIVRLDLGDAIAKYHRTWIVQCKFSTQNVSPSDLSENNIPTLIHANNAIGYLLICRNGVTAKLASQFTDLTRSCTFQYRYCFWTGEDFLQRLLPDNDLLRQFFPKYYSFLKRKEHAHKKKRRTLPRGGRP